MTLRAGAVIGACLIALGLAGCQEEDVGYVEVKLVPGYRLPPLALGSTRIASLKNGNAVLKQPVGAAVLQFERNGLLFPFCRFEVKKNRIVTVSISAIGRDPRCKVVN